MVDPNSKNDRKLQELMKVIKLTTYIPQTWVIKSVVIFGYEWPYRIGY